jgi:hypothetical protein
MPRPIRSLAVAALLAVAAATLPANAAADERNAYVALKGGAFFPTATSDVVVSGLPAIGSLKTGPAFELAIGANWVLLGAQLSVGWYHSGNANIEVNAFPITGIFQLRIPIVFVVPYAEAGVGAWITSAKNIPANKSSTIVAFETLAGLGVDFYLGPLLLGAEAKYIWVKPTYSWNLSSVRTSVTLQENGVVVTLNLGYRF